MKLTNRPYPLQRLRIMVYLCFPITFIAFAGVTAQPYKNAAYLRVTGLKLSITYFFIFVFSIFSSCFVFFFLYASLPSFINLSSIFSSFITHFCPYSLPPFFHSLQVYSNILVLCADCRNCVFLRLRSLAI